MNWTTEKPTQPGFYYYSAEQFGARIPTILVRVQNENGVLNVYDAEYDSRKGRAKYGWINWLNAKHVFRENDLWYGPLEPPPLEKEQP